MDLRGGAILVVGAHYPGGTLPPQTQSIERSLTPIELQEFQEAMTDAHVGVAAGDCVPYRLSRFDYGDLRDRIGD